MAESWKLEGTYFEACNCDVACPCVLLRPPTQGECRALVAWHIDSGHLGGHKLDGLNVALGLHSPGTLTDGNWKVALYLDERASADQQQALTQIFGGQVGGHPAKLASYIGEVLGISTAPIEYVAQGKRRSLRLGQVGEMEIEAVGGPDDPEATVQGHPFPVTPGYPIVVSQSKKLRYKDYGYDWTISDHSGYYSPFTYSG